LRRKVDDHLRFRDPRELVVARKLNPKLAGQYLLCRGHDRRVVEIGSVRGDLDVVWGLTAVGEGFHGRERHPAGCPCFAFVLLEQLPLVLVYVEFDPRGEMAILRRFHSGGDDDSR
jgi:hypothetical protein